MIEKTPPSQGPARSEANTTFDDLVRPKTPKRNRFFVGGRGNDTYSGTSKSDFALGRGGNDSLKGGAGNDFLSGGRGDDKISGGSGNDRLFGGKGNDTIETGTGSDRVKAGRGNDTIIVEGSAFVDGGSGRDSVVLKGAREDYAQSRQVGPNQIFFDQRDGSRIELANVENVRFSEVTPPPPPKPPEGPSLQLAPNDAGADRIIVGSDSIRILGPNTDFTFTDLRDQRPVDGPLTARAGSGIINGQQVNAVPIGFGDVVFSLGSGFNSTGTQAVRASFDNGVQLESQIVRPTVPTPVPVPTPEPVPVPPKPPVGKGQALAPNTIGAERIFVGLSSIRIVGPNTDFTFTGIRDGRPADGPLTATAGSGVINGVETTAVPIGNSNPFEPNNSVVFSLSSGFNPTGTQRVTAAFATGDRLATTIAGSARPILPQLLVSNDAQPDVIGPTIAPGRNILT